MHILCLHDIVFTLKKVPSKILRPLSDLHFHSFHPSFPPLSVLHFPLCPSFISSSVRPSFPPLSVLHFILCPFFISSSVRPSCLPLSIRHFLRCPFFIFPSVR